MVRVPPEVHRNLAIQALESGVTLSVIGRNAVGNRQSESSSATYTWTVEAVNLTDAIFALQIMVGMSPVGLTADVNADIQRRQDRHSRGHLHPTEGCRNQIAKLETFDWYSLIYG
jgi:hypothetical protein